MPGPTERKDRANFEFGFNLVSYRNLESNSAANLHARNAKRHVQKKIQCCQDS